MANILELQEKRVNLKAELDNLVKTAEAETRKLNEGEETRMNEIKQSIAVTDKEIEAIEAENRKLNENKKEKKQVRTMGLIKSINDVIANRSFDENTQAEINSAKEEFRKSGLSAKGQIQMRATVNVSNPTEGQENVAEVKAPIEVALRNNLVASKIGASYLGGLVGNISIPKYAGSNVGWKNELEEAEDGAGAWDEITLSPKRLTAFVDVSKEFLLQDSNDAEAMLINDLAKAITEKLDKTIFGSEAGDTSKPAGLFNGVSATTSLDAVDYSTVLGLEEAIEEKNGSDYVFVVDPKTKFALKGIQKANGLQMVLEGNEIDGINYVSSNSVKAKGILAIDPKSLVIGQWGGIDITVDPLTQATKGCVRLVVNCYFDAAMKSDRIKAEVFS